MVERGDKSSIKDTILNGFGVIDKATVVVGGIFAILGALPIATFLVLTGGVGLAAEEYLKD